MTADLPIRLLLETRCKELRLSHAALVSRLGYKNKAKGLRRLDQILVGDFKTLIVIIQHLPEALEVPVEIVNQAVDDTKKQLHGAREQASRAAFKPHAIILTERAVPSPIFVAAVLGVDRLLRIDFDLSKDPSTFVSQALSGLNQKLQKWGSSIPAFGKPIGFVINYTYDRHGRFDLDGKLVELKGQHQQLGEATLTVSGRKSLADIFQL